MTLKKRKITFIVIFAGVLGFVALLYFPASRLLEIFRTHEYQYSYFPAKEVLNASVAQGEPAIAVPILMYHGVLVQGELGTNTTREEFISQMEMLKREGYQTISVAEFDQYQQGTFILPPKPIILTFDDGRKDSFYTVDEVFKKLGFKATIFIASIKPNTNDAFYLSWNELKAVKQTNRWEIEAHGRHSHDKVQIDEKGSIGRYLSSRIYDPVNELEDVESFKKRVEEDYKDSVDDLYTNLGITARYYAVPLNDYGEEDSNYPEGMAHNKELTKKYFRAAYIESLSDGHTAKETFYNYADSNPYSLKRLEVKGMTTEELKYALEKFAPSKAEATFPVIDESSHDFNRKEVVYGKLDAFPEKLIVSPVSPSTAARILLGDKGWKDYKLEVEINRGIAREAWLVLNYLDEDNLILIGWDSANINIIEIINGTEKVVYNSDFLSKDNDSVRVSATIKDSYLSVFFDGVQLLKRYHTSIPRGAPGFGVWDPKGNSVTLTSLQITESK